MKLNTQIFLGLILGVVVGLVLGDAAVLFETVGEVFLRLLKMLIIPLILSSIVMGIVSLGDVHHLGKLGGRTGFYFLGTTLLSCTLGAFIATMLKPGIGSGLTVANFSGEALTNETMSWGTIFTQIVPSNIVGSMAQGQMLPTIFFALIFGAALISIGPKGEKIIQWMDSFNEVILKLVDWVMRLAPIGVFALMAALVGDTGLEAFVPLALYILTVLLGLFIHGLIFLPIILIVFGGFSPFVLIRHASPALAMAFSTSSSMATLPITMDFLKKKVGISNRVASFVCPLGATINMDGTALYQVVASIFIAQVYGIHLSMGQLAIIVVTATLASIGAAAIPSAGLVTMAIILNAVGLPIEGIGLILAVDRILDMVRTSVNVLSDLVGSVIVARREGESLTL
ncbi:dicarboxylate/amino acid:cation symporter [bacterium]|jgi:proton glutamate symport protein|nr:dicarboxylate/amino acid:cation symporter [bacterium]